MFYQCLSNPKKKSKAYWPVNRIREDPDFTLLVTNWLIQYMISYLRVPKQMHCSKIHITSDELPASNQSSFVIFVAFQFFHHFIWIIIKSLISLNSILIFHFYLDLLFIERFKYRFYLYASGNPPIFRVWHRQPRFHKDQVYLREEWNVQPFFLPPEYIYTEVYNSYL